MSHIVTIQTQLHDPVAIRWACARLQIPYPVPGKHRLYSRTVEGWGVQLKGWNYPVVIDLKTGQAQFDNFEGRWGEPSELDRFTQAYAVAKATREARRLGYSIREQTLPDGSIKLTVQTGGAA